MDVGSIEVTNGRLHIDESLEGAAEVMFEGIDRTDQAAAEEAMKTYAKYYNRTTSYSFMIVDPDWDHLTVPKMISIPQEE